MTAGEPEVDRSRADAVAVMARHLAGRLAPGIDAELVAGHLLDLIHDQGWRYIPRPERIPPAGRRDPATAHRGADLAREALGLPKRTETEGDARDG